ncbi:hypothetical protein AB0M46_21130 [Dactylosporangium sp. NPDC051485]|uniref:hypothetical protein n=1 Tax=Dactylosporangium sp. NPDC051485 TaxID=3154846 RepID=UPI0034341142
MAHVAMTSPLAPVVAAVEGLRRRHPALTRCVTRGLVITPTAQWSRAINPEAAAVLLVAGWTRARRVPLLIPGETFVNRAGQLGVRRAHVAVLADDPAAGAPGVVVAGDRMELLDLVAEHAGAEVSPWELARHVTTLLAATIPPTPAACPAAALATSR